MQFKKWLFIPIYIMLVDAALAAPQIVIYNYAPQPPALQLVSITPQNHQEFNVSPPAVTVTFSQTIVPEKSDIKVYDPYNNVIGGAKEIPKDAEMKVTLPEHLLAGAYRIEWTATCACQGNPVANGSSYFTVY